MISHMAAYILHTTVELPFGNFEKMLKQRQSASDLGKNINNSKSASNEKSKASTDGLVSVTTSTGEVVPNRPQKHRSANSSEVNERMFAKPFLLGQRQLCLYQTNNMNSNHQLTNNNGSEHSHQMLSPGNFDSTRVAKYKF